VDRPQRNAGTNNQHQHADLRDNQTHAASTAFAGSQYTGPKYSGSNPAPSNASRVPQTEQIIVELSRLLKASKRS
jgi:hypothetical protein